MTIGKKLSAAVLTLLISLLLPLGLSGSARAEEPSEETNRFNVVLVVDKSGSLRFEKGHGTDPDGLRFDALRLFLGLLTENGNHVGAVIFDEQIRYDSGIKPVDGMDAKKTLIHTIEGFSPGFDTDIGSAVLRAVELLRGMKEQNDLPCMILLFSDGMTDFTANGVQSRMQSSYANAQKALDAAKEEGITINGILLNVDDAAERGRVEFQLYAHGTGGEFEEVTRPEDLTSAFRRIYHIINNTVYTGAQRVAFSERGEAEIFFTVPSFGVEEVNVIVEGKDLRNEGDEEKVVLEITRPDGDSFDVSGHDLDSSRYRFVKIPRPNLGIWSVRLKGEPEDWVDVTMVCNASLSVALSGSESTDSYRTYVPCRFTAAIADPGVPRLTEDQLRELRAVLVCEELATGAVREYDMEFQDGGYSRAIRFPKSGEYRLSAVVGLGDFKVRSDALNIVVNAAPLAAKVSTITDMLRYGHFREGVWELALDELFGADRDSGLQYTLSDDCGGILSVEDGVLRARLKDAQPFSFTLTATDPMGQHAGISFELSAPKVAARVSHVSDILELGRYHDSQWEAELSDLFYDPKDCPLEYALSYDYGGAVSLENGVLRVRLEGDEQPLSFVVTATDFTHQSEKISFDLSVPTVTAKVAQVTNMMRLGHLHDFQWELPLDGLFYDSRGLPLKYTLSDDYGGAVALEDGMMRVDFHELRKVNFDLTAANALDQQAVISFKLKVPGPSVSVGSIEETVKTGLFQEDFREWKLGTLFGEPKGTPLSYALSDDFGGAAEISDGVLRVNMKGLKKAVFSVKATDGYQLSAEIPITLTEKNMTLVYLLWALLALLAICIPTGVVIYLRRR